MASRLPPARPPSAITLSFSVDSRTLPHEQDKKENMCGCAGCFTAPAALELYAHVFDQVSTLDSSTNSWIRQLEPLTTWEVAREVNSRGR